MTAAPGDITFRVVMVGAPTVGKTTIARLWSRETQFPAYTPTAERRTYWAVIHKEERNCLLLIDDLPGNVETEKARDTLQNADAMVLVYSVVRRQQTMQALSSVWLPRVLAAAPEAVHLLVANRGNGAFGAAAFVQMQQEEMRMYKQLSRYRECVQLNDGLRKVGPSAETAKAYLLDTLLKHLERHVPDHRGQGKAYSHRSADSDHADASRQCSKCLKFIASCVCGGSSSTAS